jgi:transcriptional regulator GlxA family with amidase domain
MVKRRSSMPPGGLAPLRGRMADTGSWSVGVIVYRGVTTVEVELPAARVADRLHAGIVHVGPEPGSFHGVEPARAVIADTGPDDDYLPEVLVIPGGLGWRQVAEDHDLARWLARAADHARGVLAISTGTLLLAAAGRLVGRPATGHWLAEDDLAGMGADVQSSRVAQAEAGRLVTASGSLAAVAAADELANRAGWASR